MIRRRPTDITQVIVYAGGANFMVQENVALWRELGRRRLYRRRGADDRCLGEADFSARPARLEALTRDMEVALAEAKRLPDADAERVAAIGFSYGGAAAVLSPCVTPRWMRVIGYDASFISEKVTASRSCSRRTSTLNGSRCRCSISTRRPRM